MAENDTQAQGGETGEKFGILYGRKWQIKIFKEDTSLDVSDLKCVFKATYNMGTALSVGTLTVYNMNAQTEAAVITEGFEISIFGGYEQGQYGEIYTGRIVQVIRNREDGINYKLEILAVNGFKELEQNWVRSSIAAQATPREIAQQVLGQADTPLGEGQISEKLSQQPLPRGKILFGKPYKYLREIALNNNAFFQLNNEKKVDLICITDEIPENMLLYLTPETGLVGTPKYTDNGIQIQMLLDARVKLQSLIHIDNELIQAQHVAIDPSMSGKNNSTPQQTVFDENGEYQVLQVIHSGDTWGDDWTTSVIAVPRNGKGGLPTQLKSDAQTMQ